jgi:hypothetical protein
VTEVPNPHARPDRLPIGELVARILTRTRASRSRARRDLRIERACQALVDTPGRRALDQLGAHRADRGARGRDPADLRARSERAGADRWRAPALTGVVEGAEDDVGAVRELGKLRSSGDALVRLGERPHAPYAPGSSTLAAGARTIGITCVPDSPIATRRDRDRRSGRSGGDRGLDANEGRTCRR